MVRSNGRPHSFLALGYLIDTSQRNFHQSDSVSTFGSKESWGLKLGSPRPLDDHKTVSYVTKRRTIVSLEITKYIL